MADLPRVTAKIFASSADENDIGQFGSALAGNKLLTDDIATIQALPAYEEGWRAAVLSTRNYPTLQEMNGLQKTFSQQIAYVLQKGIADWDSATTYYTNDFCKFGNQLYYSLQDNNTNKSPLTETTYWQEFSSGGGGGGEIGANVDLTNLTSFGNGKFQFAPFSINNGSIDSDGANETLITEGGTPISVDTYVVPQLASNVSEYGTTNDYTMTGYLQLQWQNYTNPWTMSLNSDYYIPAGATVTFTIATNNGSSHQGGGSYIYIGCKGCKITYTYTDDTSEVIFDENATGNFASWNSAGAKSATVTLPVANKTVKGISVTGYAYGNYYYAYGFTFKAEYNITTSATLICEPCTITTADSRSKTFDANNILDCSDEADGTYKVMKDYVYGSLSLNDRLLISKTEPQAITDVVWTQPAISSNGTMGVDDFAVTMSSQYSSYAAWHAFNADTGAAALNASSGYLEFYSSTPIKVQSITMRDQSATYPVNSGSIEAGNSEATLTQLTTFTNSVHGSDFTINVNSDDYYTYYRINVAGSNNPFISNIRITATYQVGSSFSDGDLWLDNSEYPLTLKQYDSDESDWVVNNNLVYIGEVTVSSGLITTIKNRYFNACPAIRLLVDSYQNGISGYDIYSDSYCVQRGVCTSGTAVVLLKPYKTGDYALSVPYSAKSASGFTPSQTGNWITQGYIE